MISIVIPIYNSEKYLEKCIHSVIAQSYTNWECILVDDGSNDRSGSISDSFQKKDCRIRVIHQKNQGVSVARNIGIKIARGEYITFVDSDDWLSVDYLSDLLNALSPDVDVVVSGIIMNYTNQMTKDVYFQNQTEILLTSEFTELFVLMNEKSFFYGPCCKLYRSSIIKTNNIEFPNNLSYGEDLLFNYQYLDFVNKIVCVPFANYHYRMLGSNTLSTLYRENQFDIDYSQWKVLCSFYKKRRMWLECSKKYLYKKLWGIIYDALFSNSKNDIYYIKKILAIPEIEFLKTYNEMFYCAKWIKYIIIHRCAYLFYVILKIR